VPINIINWPDISTLARLIESGAPARIKKSLD
jgi:hypothetical protein